jgi:hypothetical protein
MSIVTAPTQRTRKSKKGYRRLSMMVLAASVPAAVGFAIFPSHAKIPFLMELSRGEQDLTTRISNRQRSLSLKYTYDDDNKNTVLSDKDDAASSSMTRIPFVANPADNIRYENKKNEHNEDTVVSKDSTAALRPTDISDTIKKVLNAPVIPSEEKEEDIKQMQRLILPINKDKVKKIGVPKSASTVVSNSNSLENGAVATEKDTRRNFKSDLRRRWHRLRPGQKFQFRLGVISIAFVSLWNTVVIRAYSGFITGILTGAAASTTATGFGSLLRRWFSNRGFQGIAALGRSVAYGWAIFVAYPRMLDRRAKERRLKREEKALDQWRRYLKRTADEVVRLRKELSLLEGEIRAFRREVLAIRAGRIESGAAMSKKIGNADSDGNNSTHRDNYNNSSNKSDRILREAIIIEMTHLTQLRDDTRLALTTARKRWSEVRSKRPIGQSQSALTSAFDTLEFELDAAADFEYDGMNTNNANDDHLLSGF